MTTISFEISDPGVVRLDVYDVAGRLVTTLLNESCETGRCDVIWDGRDSAGRTVSAGVYHYRMEAGGNSTSRQMTLIK